MEADPHLKITRVPVSLPATLAILIPEAILQPAVVDCVVIDLNQRGAMLTVELPPEVFRELLRKHRYCRVAFREPEGIPEKLIGKAVWNQPISVSGRTAYKIGIAFEKVSEEEADLLRNYIYRQVNTTPDPDL